MFESYPDILSVDQVCEALQIGKNTAYNLMSNGGLRSIKMGNIWKIPKYELIDFVNRNLRLQSAQIKDNKKELVKPITYR